MKLKYPLMSFLSVALLLLPAWGDPPPAAEPLRVGVTATFPPIIYKENGKLVGMEADFAKVLGEELGRPIQFVEVKWEDQIPALAEGKTDIIMSGMSITSARTLRVAFSNPYLAMGQIALVRREDANMYAIGFPIMPRGTIGVIKATTGDFMVQQEFSRSTCKSYKTPQDAAKALAKKKIDLFICDAPIVAWLSGMYEVEGLVPVPIFLTEEKAAWAVRKSDSELLATVNKALEKIQKDGRADAIIKHWIPMYKMK